MRGMTNRKLDETQFTFADLSRTDPAFVCMLIGIFHVHPKHSWNTVED